MSLTSFGAVNLSPYQQAIRADGAIGYWRMDAPSGLSELDRTGRNHPGVITGGVTLNQTGALADLDRAQLLNGTSGFVRVASASVFDITSAISVETWVKCTAVASYGFLISKSTGGADGYELFRSTGTGQMRWSASAASVATFDLTTTPAFNDGLWHHVVGTYDPVTAKKAILYVDGVNLASSGSLTTALTVDASDLFLGARGAAGNLFFAGSLDEVAIYNVALSAAQVMRHFQLRQARRLRPAA